MGTWVHQNSLSIASFVSRPLIEATRRARLEKRYGRYGMDKITYFYPLPIKPSLLCTLQIVSKSCSDFRSSSQCDLMGASKLIETSPSSSEESPSPSEGGYRRLGERQPLMKRIAMGFSGALLQPSDDDSTPLVTDTPTTLVYFWRLHWITNF